MPAWSFLLISIAKSAKRDLLKCNCCWMESMQTQQASPRALYPDDQLVQQSVEQLKNSATGKSRRLLCLQPRTNFIVVFHPRVLGLVLTLTGTLVSSVTLVKGRLGHPRTIAHDAANLEILVAKIVPLLVMLNGTVLLALTIGVTLFHLPSEETSPRTCWCRISTSL